MQYHWSDQIPTANLSCLTSPYLSWTETAKPLLCQHHAPSKHLVLNVMFALVGNVVYYFALLTGSSGRRWSLVALFVLTAMQMNEWQVSGIEGCRDRVLRVDGRSMQQKTSS